MSPPRLLSCSCKALRLVEESCDPCRRPLLATPCSTHLQHVPVTHPCGKAHPCSAPLYHTPEDPCITTLMPAPVAHPPVPWPCIRPLYRTPVLHPCITPLKHALVDHPCTTHPCTTLLVAQPFNTPALVHSGQGSYAQAVCVGKPGWMTSLVPSLSNAVG